MTSRDVTGQHTLFSSAGELELARAPAAQPYVRTDGSIGRIATAEKRRFKLLMRQGAIATKSQLLAAIAASGHTVLEHGKIPETGDDFVAIHCAADQSSFRLRFSLTDDIDGPPPAEVPRHHLIYLLWATDPVDGRSAAYVGKTVDLAGRMRKHFLRQRSNNTSFELFQWADGRGDRGAEVRCTVLENFHCTVEEACLSEHGWLRRAIRAGFETPGVQRWGVRRSAPVKNPAYWPAALIRAASLPMAEAVTDQGVATLLAQPGCAAEV